MHLKFRRLIISEFKSFRGKHVIRLADYGAGLHFIRGRNLAEPDLQSNGAGKTSLWDALSWCLFGRSLRGVRTPVLRPWHPKGTTRVRVDLTTDMPLSIIRTADPNRLVVVKAGVKEDIGQDELERLIGLTFPLFTHCVLMGQAAPLFFDLSPTAKLQLLSDTLGLDQWLVRAKAAKRRQERLEDKLHKLAEDLARSSALVSEYRAEFRRANREYKDYEQSRAEKLRLLGVTLRARKTQFRAVEKIIHDEDTGYAKIEVIVNKLDAKHKKVLDEMRDERYRAEGARTNLNLAQQELDNTKDLRRSASVNKPTCPTCGQAIRPGDAPKLLEHYEEKAKLAHHAIVSQKKAIRVHTEKAAELSTKAGNIESVLNHRRKDQERHRAILDKAKSERARCAAELEIVRRQIRELHDDDNPHAAGMKRAKKSWLAERDSLEVLVVQRKVFQRKVRRTKFWVKGFKLLRLDLLDRVLGHIEIATNATLPELGLRGYKVHYAVERETKSGTVSRGFAVSIESPVSRRPVPWESWSGGEGQRLRLAGSFAVSEVLLDFANIRPSLEVLDEPTRGLSSKGIADLCAVLRERGRRLGRAIFFIDHHAIESDAFDSVTTVTRDKRGSHVSRAA